MDASFERIGGGDASDGPRSPVVLSVPHAGRDYPPELIAALRLPATALTALEDRHVDRIARGARTDETLFAQHRARAWIDLNRSEEDRDPRIDDGARPQALPGLSAKVRSGLGLVPRRAGAAGDLWRRRFGAAEVTARIVADHRPYHDALAKALAAARARFGIAVLLDVHSMPPTGQPAQVVLGDRFGRAAASRFVARLGAVADANGIPSAVNTPYAGGHILERHADPARGVHGIQIEIDRTLYLDHRLDRPGPGLERTIALLRQMIAAMREEALGGSSFALAAE